MIIFAQMHANEKRWSFTSAFSSKPSRKTRGAHTFLGMWTTYRMTRSKWSSHHQIFRDYNQMVGIEPHDSCGAVVVVLLMIYQMFGRVQEK